MELSEFVDRKEEWIGGILVDNYMGMLSKTEITDIRLVPNGKDSSFFSVHGEEFTCGFDVRYGNLVSSEEGWVVFSGYGGHTWRIKNWEKTTQEKWKNRNELK